MDEKGIEAMWRSLLGAGLVIGPPLAAAAIGVPFSNPVFDAYLIVMVALLFLVVLRQRRNKPKNDE